MQNCISLKSELSLDEESANGILSIQTLDKLRHSDALNIPWGLSHAAYYFLWKREMQHQQIQPRKMEITLCNSQSNHKSSTKIDILSVHELFKHQILRYLQ